MEIMTYADVKKDYISFSKVDWQELTEKIEKNPEDYVFIFDEDENKKFLEFNTKMVSHKKGPPFEIDQAQYGEKYPGLVVIIYLLLKLEFAKKYKAGLLDDHRIKPGHAFFFIKRGTNENERSVVILKRILSFRANTNKPSNLN